MEVTFFRQRNMSQRANSVSIALLHGLGNVIVQRFDVIYL